MLRGIDTVITNALIVDAVAGIVKADVGIKNGKIRHRRGKSSHDVGRRQRDDRGTTTDVIAGEKFILTAGAMMPTFTDMPPAN